MVLIWFEIDLGAAMIKYYYSGMACRIERSKTNIPERFKDLKFQLEIFFVFNLVTRDSQLALARGLSVKGTLRYLEGKELS